MMHYCQDLLYGYTLRVICTKQIAFFALSTFPTFSPSHVPSIELFMNDQVKIIHLFSHSSDNDSVFKYSIFHRPFFNTSANKETT